MKDAHESGPKNRILSERSKHHNILFQRGAPPDTLSSGSSSCLWESSAASVKIDLPTVLPVVVLQILNSR